MASKTIKLAQGLVVDKITTLNHARAIEVDQLLWSKVQAWNDFAHWNHESVLGDITQALVDMARKEPIPRTVGIEIEVENMSLGAPDSPLGLSGLPDTPYGWRVHVSPDVQAFWKIVEDGSLRYGGIELVSIPMVPAQAELTIPAVYEAMGGRGSFGFRTSTHVHVDVGDYTPLDLLKLILIYLPIEKLLFARFPKERSDNVYCVPIQSTDVCNMIGGYIFKWSVVGNLENVWQKYGALNLQSTFQKGTVEFRHMHGSPDPQSVIDWMHICERLVSAAKEMPIEDVVHRIMTLNTSSQYQGFLRTILQDHYGLLPAVDLQQAMEGGVAQAKTLMRGTADQTVFMDSLLKDATFRYPYSLVLERQ